MLREKKAATEEFFKWLKICRDEIYLSELVLAELSRAPLPLRTKLLDVAARVNAIVLPITVEVEGLARRYVAEGAIPARYRDDAMHVAIAVLNKLDVVVTWNMKHLANVRRIEAINRTNLIMGLGPIRIHTPEEVTDL